MISINFETLFDHSKPTVSSRSALTAIHSGNGGDILYSLPTVRALGVRHIFLNCFESPDPLRKLKKEMALGLVPLLLAQDFIDRVTVVRAGMSLELVDPTRINVDHILDRFRLEDFSQIHLTHAHASAMRVQIEPNEPFLTLDEIDEQERPDLVLACTPRYRFLTEEFIRELALYFPRIVILAIPAEWRVVSGISGTIRQCKDMLEMARIIKSGRLFLGNPSLASAIAEGLKVPRIIDLPTDLPNAFPIGPAGHVLPTRRAEFLDLVHELCGENARIRDTYRDLSASLHRANEENIRMRELTSELRLFLGQSRLGAAAHEDDVLLLVDQAHRFRPALLGGLSPRIDTQVGGIFLHPGSGVESVARCRFSNLSLSGYNCFEAEVALEHENAKPVRFGMKIYDDMGSLLLQSTKEIGASSRIQWVVPFSEGLAKGCLELSAQMASDTDGEEFAWAWVYKPALRVR